MDVRLLERAGCDPVRIRRRDAGRLRRLAGDGHHLGHACSQRGRCGVPHRDGGAGRHREGECFRNRRPGLHRRGDRPRADDHVQRRSAEEGRRLYAVLFEQCQSRHGRDRHRRKGQVHGHEDRHLQDRGGAVGERDDLGARQRRLHGRRHRAEPHGQDRVAHAARRHGLHGVVQEQRKRRHGDRHRHR